MPHDSSRSFNSQSQRASPAVEEPPPQPFSLPPGVAAHYGLAPVQFLGGRFAGEAHVHEVAAHGTRTAGQSLPHLPTIQSSFGHHDVSGVKAHLGAAATQANALLGSEAFATGSDVSFRGSPTLHTAAHEAAHVVQQRGGVHLKDGLGRAGDEYERHADEVADCVVAGGSAEGLLDRMAPPGAAAAAPAVQRKLTVKGVGGPWSDKHDFDTVRELLLKHGLDISSKQDAVVDMIEPFIDLDYTLTVEELAERLKLKLKSTSPDANTTSSPDSGAVTALRALYMFAVAISSIKQPENNVDVVDHVQNDFLQCYRSMGATVDKLPTNNGTLGEKLKPLFEARKVSDDSELCNNFLGTGAATAIEEAMTKSFAQSFSQLSEARAEATSYLEEIIPSVKRMSQREGLRKLNVPKEKKQ